MTFKFGAPGITRCLLVECDAFLVLVDTGLGMGDYLRPTRAVAAFTSFNKIPCDLEETAFRQVVGLGYAPEDVRHIVLTHLHLDHAGGLPDFPWAQVHVFAPELEAALHPLWYSTFEVFAYISEHWAHRPDWIAYSLKGETWFDIDCASLKIPSSTKMRFVPLVGHTRGHCGVAICTNDGWLLHCGDAFIRSFQINHRRARSPFPWWARPFERRMFPKKSLEKLKILQHNYGGEIKIFCTHEPTSFSNSASSRGGFTNIKESTDF